MLHLAVVRDASEDQAAVDMMLAARGLRAGDRFMTTLGPDSAASLGVDSSMVGKTMIIEVQEDDSQRLSSFRIVAEKVPRSPRHRPMTRKKKLTEIIR